MNFESKKWWEVKFSYKTKASIHYPNEENEFMVPNDEKKKDYCVNPCLSQLIDEH